MAESKYGNIAIDMFDSTNTNWKRWLMRFEGAVAVFDIEETKKVAYLLHFIGAKSFDILCDSLSPKDPYSATYNELTAKLEEFYAPTPLEVAENFRFHQRKQIEGESVREYVAALHKLSIHCKFGGYLQNALRNQFVYGLTSKRSQSRLLEMKDLTFERAVETAISMELTEKDVNQIQTGTASVNAVAQKNPGPKRNRQEGQKKMTSEAKTHASAKPKYTVNPNQTANHISCFRCGGKHLVTSCTLNKNIACRNCGTKGHLQKVCMRKKPVTTNQLNDTTQLNDILCLQTGQERYRQKYMVTVKIEGRQIRFEIDSGAAVTIVSRYFLEKWLKNVPIKNTDLRLTTYCKTSVKVIGYVEVKVEYNDVTRLLHMYVTDTDREPLLGREWIRQLQVQLNNTLYTLVEDTERLLQNTLVEYQNKLDEKSTKIRDVQARLTLVEGARPVFLKARRVPFKLIPLVEQEIDRMEAEGILERVNTSAWATPIVPVLKKGNKVRVCGDFSVTLNQNLQIDEYPLPTTDELFSTLAGGEKCSKIDLKKAYLQMEVHLDDREYLTLNTHRGLFRCTRLLYGIASALAIWQREMEKILGGISGISVFLDDIKVTGK